MKKNEMVAKLRESKPKIYASMKGFKHSNKSSVEYFYNKFVGKSKGL
jgi:hypothetical protein